MHHTSVVKTAFILILRSKCLKIINIANLWSKMFVTPMIFYIVSAYFSISVHVQSQAEKPSLRCGAFNEKVVVVFLNLVQ